MTSVHRRRRAVRAKFMAQAILLLFALISPRIPATRAQETPRSKAQSLKLMCVCGCNQILGQCNHIGCSYSYNMLKELDDRNRNHPDDPDDLTLQAFVQEYGPAVLAEPPSKGFSRAAWLMPVVVPLLSLYLLWEVVRRWRQRAAIATASGPKIPPELLARAHRESSRELGEDSND